MEREFSVGDYAYKRGQNKPVKIDQIDLDIYLHWCSNKYTKNPPLKGIPLTEEWMVKFGIKENEKINESIFCIQKGKDFYQFCLLINDVKICLSFFKYVHQLQGLYHSLTGQELTIND